MRILHVIHGLPPERWGGAEVYTRNVAAAQAALGHQVTVFTTSPVLGARGYAQPATEQAADGVTLVRVPLPPARLSENPAAQLWHTVRDRGIEAHFAAVLAEAPPDVVHFQHVQGMSAALIALAAHAGVPARLATLHDYWFFCANSQLRRPGDEPCTGPSTGCRNCVDCMTLRTDLRPLRSLRPLVALPLAWRNRYLDARLSEVHRYIAPSAFLRDRYVEQGLPPDRIHVLENGIQPAAGHAEPLPMAGTRPRFVYVGSLAPHKGVHVLVQAFNRMPAGASLTIIGGEGQEAGYMESLRGMATHPGIAFAGSQEQAVVHATLRAADCLVAPSLWYENSPLVVQEAYAAGLPVVASRIGALEEKVVDGVSGRLFPPSDVDALAELLLHLHANPEELAALRSGVRAPVPIEEHTAALLGLYAQVLHPLA